MAQAILNKIIGQLQKLELKELQELEQAVQQQLVTKLSTYKSTTFHKALLDSGLVKQIKQPNYRQQTEQQLIKIQGKFLSETIVEERR
ncbi:hypothetical protein WA1_36905 [Scytonema hofmannii PCC 7110]|uniref:Uncharacterized protein n=1 Tax=Scytonema hofmannii PCC 7110 TaxID=128403 RepID=A0A139X209_9CYAN|nr:hypothetical protein [Scytonema hofmannii]KYC38749.1 hypothetical protein WA1_36905 [Scytonema hofmannii PCC 7110]